MLINGWASVFFINRSRSFRKKGFSMLRPFYVLLLGFIISVIQSGCAGRAVNVIPFQVKAKTVQHPKLNNRVAAEVGEAIIFTENIFTRPAIELENPMRRSVMLTLLDAGILTIPAGKLVASNYLEDHSGVLYQSLSPSTVENLGDFLRRKHSVKAGIVVYRENRPTEYYYLSPFSGIPVLEPDPSISFKTAKNIEWEQGSFRKELVYNGRTGDSIKLLYREFKDDFALPAFSQEVSYDISAEEIFGFKGARFKVIDASNVSISYVVIKHIS